MNQIWPPVVSFAWKLRALSVSDWFWVFLSEAWNYIGAETVSHDLYRQKFIFVSTQELAVLSTAYPDTVPVDYRNFRRILPYDAMRTISTVADTGAVALQ